MAEAPWRTQGPTGPPGVGRHKSDVSDRRAEPPLCVQNAMLTKDKKPFTYTPGGIDLSEIKSPRMARRIEINANAPGVGDVIHPVTPQGPVGPLPPSALAAMQPALPVQVFPSAPPPPPIPPANIPPPPPPMVPLPTKSVATLDGVFERPDMTKIIPENPMALLRKTPGVNRRSFIEEPDYSPVNTQNYNESPKPQYSETQVQMQPPAPQPQFMQPKPQPQMVNQPQFNSNSVPSQDSLPEVKTSTAQLGSLYIPPLNTQEVQQKTASSPPAPPPRRIQTPEQYPESPQSPLATLHKSPRPWQNQKLAQQELPPWAQRSQSPPLAQQQSPPTNAQPQRFSPPPQQQQFQRQVPASPVPQYQRQEPISPAPQQQQQPRLIQQVRPSQQHQPGQPTIVGRVIIPVQMEAEPAQNNKDTEAVYVTQPVVLQHPGARVETNQQSVGPQQRFAPNQASQQQKVTQPQPNRNQAEMKGTRIIPIQIEGASNANVQRQDSKLSTPGTTPTTPGSARSFTRQPSWSSTPTQSNSFKVIQKITNTDGDDDEDQITTEHSPKNSQHFQQVPADQMRKMKLNDSDRELMNKFKQGVDEENSIHKEVDPRYRGASIPSKAFRFLQSMTDGPDAEAVSSSVPRNAQNTGGSGSNRGAQVRTIPIKIEGENSGKLYIPPSEQTVEEPKKYTGSAIPSRSFKILQAMTGDTCDVGQANETNENFRFDPSYYWGYNPDFLPMPPPAPFPPYWQYYYSNYPVLNNDSKDIDRRSNSRNSTPVAFKTASGRKQNFESENSSSNRNTPLPFGNLSQHSKQVREDSDSNTESDFPRKNTSLPYWNVRQSPLKHVKQSKENSDSDSEFEHSRRTPLPFWNYPTPAQFTRQKKSNIDTDSECDTPRNTPLPFWNYPYYSTPPQFSKQKKANGDTDSECDTPRNTPLPSWNYPTQAQFMRKKKTNGDIDSECDTPTNTPLPFWIYPTPAQYSRQKRSNGDTDSESDTPRNTPLPFWSYYPPPNQYYKQAKTNVDTDSESDQPRHTPVPFWGCYSPFYPIPFSNNETDSETEQSKSCRTTPVIDQKEMYNGNDNGRQNQVYPPFWNPYSYYPYFCGYPPLPPPPIYPYPIYPQLSANNSEIPSYPSMDEMTYFNNEKTSSTSTLTPVQQSETYAESDMYEDDSSSSEDESETEAEEEQLKDNLVIPRDSGLQTIKSVSDINVYNEVDITNCTDDEGDNVSERSTTEDNDDVSLYTEEEEMIPHQLSVIYEESERSDASRMIRESSVVSADTLTIGTVDDIDQDLQYPIVTEPDEDKKSEDLLLHYPLIIETEQEEENNNDSEYIEKDKELGPKSSTANETEFNNESLNNAEEISVSGIEENQLDKLSSSSEEKDWWSVIGSNEEEIYIRKTVTENKFIDATENQLEEVPTELKTNQEEQEDAVDFWQIIGENESLNASMKRENNIDVKNLDDESNCLEVSRLDGPDSEANEWNENSSTSSSDTSSVCSESTKISEKIMIDRESTKICEEIINDMKDSEISEKITTDMEKPVEENIKSGNEVKMPTIKERIQALQEASKNKFDDRGKAKTTKNKITEEASDVKGNGSIGANQFNSQIENENSSVDITSPKYQRGLEQPIEKELNLNSNKSNDKEEIDSYESTRTKSLSTKSSVKSFEDISEDEIDSGVTSDISRHISDNESDFPELRKMTKYQRAATHSRLFKLLQEECEQEEINEKCSQENVVENNSEIASVTTKNAILKEHLEKEKLNEEILIRRENLSLPLNNKNISESDSFTSSGINSPGSPVINERLVNELVHSLLRRKKSHIFRNMSMEKLHSAAVKILQEELESSDTSYEEFISPVKNLTTSQEYQTNYMEYAQYYDSWSEAERLYQKSYDILPSKAFKLLQDQAVMNKAGSISGFLAKCPRILSSKNIHKELISVLESRESPIPNSGVETKGAASAS